MLKSTTISTMTIFLQASLEFGDNLNVIVAENGAGKAHLLKIAY